VAERWQQFLQQCAVPTEPGTIARDRERIVELRPVAAAHDVAAPAAEARLEDERRLERRAFVPAEDRRPRMWKPCGAKQVGGAELVVHGEQRRGAVEHADATALEPEQLEQPRLDAVERGQHVESGQDGVTGPQHLSRVERREELGPEAEPAPLPDQLAARLVRLTAEHPHAGRRVRAAMSTPHDPAGPTQLEMVTDNAVHPLLRHLVRLLARRGFRCHRDSRRRERHRGPCGSRSGVLRR
jgi:hypothetical protein